MGGKGVVSLRGRTNRFYLLKEQLMDSRLPPSNDALYFTVCNFASLRGFHFSEGKCFCFSCCKIPLPQSQAWRSPRIDTVCPLVYTLGFMWISCKSFALGGLFLPPLLPHKKLGASESVPPRCIFKSQTLRSPARWARRLGLVLNK